MVALAPDPEDAEKQENGADNLANPTHSLKAIPADALLLGASLPEVPPVKPEDLAVRWGRRSCAAVEQPPDWAA
jgi:hypothetical protein